MRGKSIGLIVAGSTMVMTGAAKAGAPKRGDPAWRSYGPLCVFRNFTS